MDEIINLKVWTSYANSNVLQFLGDSEILPIFIPRNISNSGLIGGWQGTAIHFGNLAPSPLLLRDWKTEKITTTEFKRLYWKELKLMDLVKNLKKLKTLRDICLAKGVALIGYGADPEEDHRFYLADYINHLGILETPITEIEMK